MARHGTHDTNSDASGEWYMSPLSTKGAMPPVNSRGYDEEGRFSLASSDMPTPSIASSDGESSPRRSPCAREGAFGSVAGPAGPLAAAAPLPPLPLPRRGPALLKSESFGSDPELEEASAPDREEVVVTPLYSPGTCFTPLEPAPPSPNVADTLAEREAEAVVDCLVAAAKRAAVPGGNLPGTPGS
eukprot:CAMPEP_0119264646 /NCGR_PEP_ID=MMETSP1329-20130426/3668_1 /TAXON_ID=114041 /ORGANISM="Genus nov. species nov., Strain RCC1024" /LENGTH=185 /DNA_ID=CAMNT_0007264429 /DNA_START=272 /DNA_END=825 /DNA_ORIENTATION=-